MEEWGDKIDAYDLIVALSPAAQRQAQEYTRYHAIDVEYWPIFDPTGLGETREAKLAAYRQARDQIIGRMLDRFGPPDEAHAGRGRLNRPPTERLCACGAARGPDKANVLWTFDPVRRPERQRAGR